MNERKEIMSAAEIGQAVEQIADAIHAEFMEKQGKDVVFLGIQMRGVPLGRCIAKRLNEKYGMDVPFGTLDITMYRDDIGKHRSLPKIHETNIPFDLNDQVVILVDDILQSGRTIRAALDAITDFGRPAYIRLAILIDRGLREFPIRADYIGKCLEIPTDERLRTEWNEQGQPVCAYSVKA